ncbi:zinc finger protein GAI-ASSOCIATED FACTOR 1-like [Phoenix dactylifera]|uniref:Protein EARLY HEADING DATE 2 n=1 Tax=Phoenix dactylifera TaxID=42345 RepID=A0A8B7CB70_PHODC|nr:zinc finger protein GAI-ASSOCIATED FACTOR 1-like [Phoenix dactylifera]XP_008795617.2 zinc finger protein GAI-ASSOCIATED FACTOR 1-like [Phoenix dactylifera]
MPVELENSSVMTFSNSGSAEASISSGQQQAPPPPPAPAKKKRNLPGMPDPDAEVIALSPKTLMATNRFVCEICNKGFQRDQNLQLHRRGHNLPWKLRQRTGKEPRKRVYVCPEPSCVHHDPSRALGDLTGIKKHFCRKHGEKKWKCDKCSKKYAVQSDWKAHSKTCGTREYRCDCGTLFSRRDSFITHRAFCDALAEESAKSQTNNTAASASAASANQKAEDDGKEVPAPATAPPAPEKSPPPAAMAGAGLSRQLVAPPEQQREPEKPPAGMLQYISPPPPPPPPPPPSSITIGSNNSSGTTSCSGGSSSGSSTSVFASLFASASATTAAQSTTFSDLIGAMSRTDRSLATEAPSLCLSTNGPASLFSQPPQERRPFLPPLRPPSPHMSATALLQKAAQMGAAATSSSSFLRGFGLATSTAGHPDGLNDSGFHWRPQQQQLEPEPTSILSAGLGLGLPYDSATAAAAAGLPDLMMGAPPLFGPKPATLDFLGLGMGPVGGPATGGLSALITSIGGGLDMGSGAAAAASAGRFGRGSSPGKAWEGAERKPNSPAIL